MKILALIQCANLGGMEQSTVLLLDELRSMGLEIELLSLNDIGPLAPVLEQQRIPASAIGYQGKWGWRSFLPLRRALQTRQADAVVMVGHNLMAMLAMGRRWQGKCVLSMHFHHRGVKPEWVWRLIYRLAVRRFRAIIFASHFIRDEAVAIAPFLKDFTQVITFPIPLPSLPHGADRVAARARLGLPAEARLVGNAGWLIPRKRWDVFIETAALVAASVPAAHFVIAGDGPERGALEARVRAFGLEPRFHWLGWQKDLADFYRSIDLMLFNSDWDAMGRTPLEAMAYGIPTVASVLNGGLREIINSDAFAVLLPGHDLPQLAGHVSRLLLDQQAAAALGAAGRQRIAEIGSPRLHALRVLKTLGMDCARLAASTGRRALGSFCPFNEKCTGAGKCELLV
jgi:glycosyltransferase involved in cell wall biosynthesis